MLNHKYSQLWIVLFMGVAILCPDHSIAGPFGPSSFEECKLEAAREAGSNSGLIILIKECRKKFKKELNEKRKISKEDRRKECLNQKEQMKSLTQIECGSSRCLKKVFIDGASEPTKICVPIQFCNDESSAGRWVQMVWLPYHSNGCY